MVCALTQEQKELLFQTIVADLFDYKKESKPFVLKDYILDIHNLIKESGQDDATSLTYAALVPQYIKLISGQDQSIDDIIEPSIAEVFKLAKQFDDVDVVSKYLFPEVKKTAPGLDESVDNEKKKKAEKTTPAKNSTVFSGRPNSLFTTTGNSSEGSKAFGYDFLRYLSDNKMITSSSSGYFLTLTRLGDILPEQFLSDDTKNEIFQVVTDDFGNPLFFNENFEPTSSADGQPVFFKQRAGKASAAEARAVIQTVPELEKTLGMSVSEIGEIINNQYKTIQQKIKFIEENPGQKFVQEITGVSRGYIPDTENKAVLDLANAEDLSTYPIRISRVVNDENKTRQVYSFYRGESKASIPFSVKWTASDLEFLRDAAQILLGNNIVDESGNPNSPLLISRRKLFSDVFFGNNWSIKISRNGELYFQTSEKDELGKYKTISTTDLSEEEALELTIQMLSKTVDGKNHVFNVYDMATDFLPFYRKNNDNTISLLAEGLDQKGYSSFMQRRSMTNLQYDSSGRFFEHNGYFSYQDIPGELSKLSQKSEAETKKEIESKKKEEPVKKLKKFQRPSFNSPDDISEKNMLEGQLTKATEKQIAEAKSWYEASPLSVIPVNVMFTIINSKNPASIANFKRSGITLFKGSDYSVLYHEAWHAFTQLVLSPSERETLYNEFKSKGGKFKTYDGKTKQYKNATDKEAEEYLADEFREYMLKGKFPKEASPVKKSIFQKILEILRILFNIEEDSIPQTTTLFEQMYNKLRVGNFMINPNPETQFESLDKIEPIEESDSIDQELTYAESKMVVDSIDAFFSKFVDEVNSKSVKKYTASILRNPKDRANAYNAVLNEFIDRYDASIEKLESLSKDDPKYATEYRKVELLEYIIVNFSPGYKYGAAVTEDDIYESASSLKGVIAYHMQKSKYLNFEERFGLEDPEEKSKQSRETFSSKAGNEVSMKELASNEVLYLIRSLFEYDKKGNPVMNDLGFNKLLPFDIAWNTVQKTLEDKFDIDEQYSALVEKAKENKSIKQLVNKLGSPNPFVSSSAIGPEDFDPSQTNLWTNFRNAFGAKRIHLVQLTINLNTHNNAITSIDVKPGKAQTEYSKIAKEWDKHFSDPLTLNKYIIKKSRGMTSLTELQKAGSNRLDIAKVIEDFEKNYRKNPVPFLRAIGIDLSDEPEIIDAVMPGGVLSILPEALMEKLKTIFKDNRDSKYPIVINSVTGLIDLNVNGQNERGNFSDLLELESRYSVKNATSMVSNASGDPQYELSLRSTISQQIDLINKASSYVELIADDKMNHLSTSRNPFIKNLIIMEELFGKDFDDPRLGNKRSVKSRTGTIRKSGIELLNSSGVTTTIDDEFDDLGIASSDADEVTQTLQNFYSYVLYGVSEATRHADKATTYLYKVQFSKKQKHFIPMSQFLAYKDSMTENNPSSAIRNTIGFQKAVSRMMMYLGSEVSRIDLLRKGDPSGNALVGDSTYSFVGNKLVIFEGILQPDTKLKVMNNISDTFYEQLTDPNNPLYEELYEKIQDEIVDYFEKQVDAFKEDLAGVAALNSDKLMKSLREGVLKVNRDEAANLPVTLRAVDISEIDPVSLNYLDESIINGYILNDWIQKYEMTVMFYGDPALYNMLKEEFHKRNPSIAATGTIPRTDDSINKILNELMPGKYQDSTYYKYSGLSEHRKIRNNQMVSAILEDTKTTSVYHEDYIQAAIALESKRLGRPADEVLIRSMFSEYDGMKEGDAQGWISFDSYRALLMRLGKWSEYQEDLYNAIIDGKDIAMKDVAKFFPIKKMQYAGPLAVSAGLPLQAFHKFSLMPLIPSVIKDTNLEILHNKMVSQGIDYATFLTGSKINTITANGKPDQFYSDKTGIDRNEVAFSSESYVFTKNPIFLDFMKEQLETPEEYKGKVIFSTQLRKLIEEGLMEAGVPTDFINSGTKEQRLIAWNSLTDAEKLESSNNYRLLINYENNISNLTDFKLRELIRDSGIDFTSGIPKLSTEFLDFIKKELTRQDLAEHEIDIIKYDNNTGELVYDLSIHPSADKIEGLLVAMVYKRLVKQKVTGEGLFQVSGAGYEKRFRKPTKDEYEKYKFGTNELGFYYSKDYLKWLNGKKDPSQPTPIEYKTKAMKVKIALQGDFKKLLKDPEVLKLAKDNSITPFEALNILIKDDTWLNVNNNRKKISMSGVRIPVQGMNSMEFAEVYEFLPEYAGNMIILPAEIVAKAGSDFDIDKLTMMFPSLFYSKKSGVNLVTHDKNHEEHIEEYKKEIQELRDKLEELYNILEEDLMVDGNKITHVLKHNIKILKQARTELKERINKAKKDNSEDVEPLFEKLQEYKDDLSQMFEQNATVRDQINEFKNANIQPVIDRIELLKENIALGSGKGLENKVLFSVMDIISEPGNFVDLITPNGTFLVKDLADKYKKFVRPYDPYTSTSNKNGAPAKSYNGKSIIEGTRIFELRYNRYKHASNNVGKRTLGLGAVDNTYNTVFTRVNAFLNPTAIGSPNGKNPYIIDQKIRMNHNKIILPDGQEGISLSNIYDVNNKNRVSTIISQMMNGWVDVAKDAWIFDIQGNIEVAPVLLFLIQAGVDIEQAVAFVSQPYVREYVNNQRIIRSTFGRALGLSASKNEVRIKAKAMILERLQGEPKITKKGKETYVSYVPYKLDIKNQTREIYQKMIPRYLGEDNFDFSLEALDKNIFTPDKVEDPDYNIKTFLHFIEIEEMAKSTTEIKLGVNVDTARTSSMFAARARMQKIQSLNAAKRMSEKVASDILTNSPISSFRVQQHMISILENLFKIRDNEFFMEYVSEKIKEDIDDYPFFSNIDIFSKAIINDFIPYAFQNWLEERPFNPTNPYRGSAIEEITVEQVTQLIAGAKIKEVNGKPTIFVDFNSLRKQLATKYAFSDKIFTELGVSPVQDQFFASNNSEQSYNKYIRFVYERETLRSLYSFSEYKSSADFALRMEDNMKQKGITEDRAAHKAYEDFLRDKALINTMNLKFMMESNDGFAKQYLTIIKNYPELLNSYYLLNSLTFVNNKKTKNLKFSELIVDSDNINVYHDELLRLMNPNVQKVDNAVDNKIISELFAAFPLFAFTQSGQDGKGQYGLSRIAVTPELMSLLNSAKSSIESKIEDQDFFKEYNKAFNRMYKDVKLTAEQAAERGVDETIVGKKRKPRVKNYYNYSSIAGLSKASLLSFAPYDSSVELYTTQQVTMMYSKSGSSQYMQGFEKQEFTKLMEKTIKENPNKVFVFDDTFVPFFTKMKSPEQRGLLKSFGFNKKAYTNSVLPVLVVDKKLPKDSILGIPTKSKDLVMSPNDLPKFKNTTEIESAKASIDAAINKLIKLRDSGKEIVFNSSGHGQALSGIGFNETRTKANRLRAMERDEVFVYLSQRLYDEFGYINPGFMSYSQSSDIFESQPITDKEVRDKINECFYTK